MCVSEIAFVRNPLCNVSERDVRACVSDHGVVKESLVVCSPCHASVHIHRHRVSTFMKERES